MNPATTRDASPQRRARTTDSAVRGALLAATRNLVAETGVDGTTSRLIAERAGVNLGSITYYFGSKEALVAEALFGELERRLAPVLDRLEADGSGPERLFAALQLVLVEFERSRPEIAVYLQALLACGRTGPLADRGRALIETVCVRLADVIVILQGDGAIAPWVDPPAMASLLIDTANGIALGSHIDPEGASLLAVTGQLVGLLLSATTVSNFGGNRS